MKSSTAMAIFDRKLSGLKSREESRDLARVIRPIASRFGVTVKADIKADQSWGVKLVHGDGKGTLSLAK